MTTSPACGPDPDPPPPPPVSSHLELLGAMVAAQTRGEEAVQEVVASALRDLGARVETVRYTPAGTALHNEFAAPSAIAAGERVAVVGRWGGGGVGDGGDGDDGGGGGGGGEGKRLFFRRLAFCENCLSKKVLH